ncbi:hypothetical protein ACFWH1_18780 [Streptomyces sp. NPDC127037]|uniref:hypothetical protein n=1 Tax=Streptomyces sp. NPDC127037 TaxID=3347113 RepID=UPI0036610287
MTWWLNACLAYLVLLDAVAKTVKAWLPLLAGAVLCWAGLRRRRRRRTRPDMSGRGPDSPADIAAPVPSLAL